MRLNAQIFLGHFKFQTFKITNKNQFPLTKISWENMNTLQAFRTVIPGAGCREMFQLPLPQNIARCQTISVLLAGPAVLKIVFIWSIFFVGTPSGPEKGDKLNFCASNELFKSTVTVAASTWMFPLNAKNEKQ